MPRRRVPVAVRLFLWRVRALLVIAGVFLAGSAIARQVAPPAPATQDVVVAAHDLAAGHRLTEADLRVVRLPSTLVPDGATPDPAGIRDRAVTVAVPAGLPLVGGLLDGDRFSLALPAGAVAVPIRLADPAVARLLRPGDHVDLVAPSGTDGGWVTGTEVAPAVLAQAALVLDVLRGTDEPDGDPLGVWGTGASAGSADDPLIVVAVGPPDGHRLAASASGGLGAVLVGGS